MALLGTAGILFGISLLYTLPLPALLPQLVGPAKLGLVPAVPALAAVILDVAASALSAIDPALALLLLVTEVKVGF